MELVKTVFAEEVSVAVVALEVGKVLHAVRAVDREMFG